MKPPPGTGYEPIVRPKMPELDCIRGVAILLVLFYHGFFWSNNVTGLHGIAKAFVEATRPGWLGVNLFFVLSGFLITGILVDSKNSAHYFRNFYTRRALRILPAYYGVLLLLFVSGLRPRAFLILSVVYLSNVTPLFGVAQAYAVLWSLAVEEHFYLLWPSVVRSLSRVSLGRCAIAIACVVPALRAASYAVGWRIGLSEYTWLVADGLAMGAWLATYVRKPGFTRRGLARVAMLAIGVSVVMTLAGARFGLLTREALLGAAFQESCGNLAFMGAIAAALLIGTGRWQFLMRRPTLKFYGDISYGLYLIHLMVFDLYDRVIRRIFPRFEDSSGHFRIMTVRFAICLGLATALAFLSRRYFEEPFLALKKRFAPTTARTRDESATMSASSNAATE
jgi:peptidoglycan/LPS O-acetylase OafA/YrhL